MDLPNSPPTEAEIPPPIEIPVFPEDAEAPDRSIPIRPADLDRMLLSEPGLTAMDQATLGQFQQLLAAVFHHETNAWLRDLKDLYAPLDPDTDCVELAIGSQVRTEEADEAFLVPFESTLVRANYRALSLDVIERAVSAPNEKGLTYEPNFELFEHLKVYVRGRTTVTRTFRNLSTRFRKREVVFPGYRRMVVILKFRPNKKLDQYVRSDVLYLRMFKDVPHVDMEMHLPEQGTKVKMRLIDKAQIASPLFAFPATLAAKALLFFAIPTVAIGTLLAAPVTAGVNSFFGFQRAKQRHLHHLIRHLYYLNLANNGSVITRIVDYAEEEDYKEALLAYFSLWRHQDEGNPWSRTRLDAHVESFLRSKTALDIDFEVGDALNKLVRLGLLHSDPHGRLRAVPIEDSLTILDRRWDNCFQFASPTAP